MENNTEIKQADEQITQHSNLLRTQIFFPLAPLRPICKTQIVGAALRSCAWEEKRCCGNNLRLVSRKYYKGLGGFRVDVCFGGGTQRKGRSFAPRGGEVKRASLKQQIRKDR